MWFKYRKKTTTTTKKIEWKIKYKIESTFTQSRFFFHFLYLLRIESFFVRFPVRFFSSKNIYTLDKMLLFFLFFFCLFRFAFCYLFTCFRVCYYKRNKFYANFRKHLTWIWKCVCVFVSRTDWVEHTHTPKHTEYRKEEENSVRRFGFLFFRNEIYFYFR